MSGQSRLRPAARASGRRTWPTSCAFLSQPVLRGPVPADILARLLSELTAVGGHSHASGRGDHRRLRQLRRQLRGPDSAGSRAMSVPGSAPVPRQSLAGAANAGSPAQKGACRDLSGGWLGLWRRRDAWFSERTRPGLPLEKMYTRKHRLRGAPRDIRCAIRPVEQDLRESSSGRPGACAAGLLDPARDTGRGSVHGRSGWLRACMSC
jgi:hypothetical protein